MGLNAPNRHISIVIHFMIARRSRSHSPPSCSHKPASGRRLHLVRMVVPKANDENRRGKQRIVSGRATITQTKRGPPTPALRCTFEPNGRAEAPLMIRLRNNGAPWRMTPRKPDTPITDNFPGKILSLEELCKPRKPSQRGSIKPLYGL